MKPNIHPDYHEITVVMTDGTSFKTRSTLGKSGESINLDIDPKTHPAWTGQHRLVDSGGQVAKFNKRFQNLGAKATAAAMAMPVHSGKATEAAPKAKAAAAAPKAAAAKADKAQKPAAKAEPAKAEKAEAKK
jgi:large subunit ribosomal protein L31